MVVAYVADFDRGILERSCRGRGLPPLAVRWECAYARYAAWRGFKTSLSTACEIEGLPPGGHRAASDARRVWELIRLMAGAVR